MHVLDRVLQNLMARVVGPLHFRLILQPAMAIFFAIRDGRQDARKHIPPYFWFILTDHAQAGNALKSGLKTLSRVLILGLVMDVIYQMIDLHWVYPGEAILVVLILVFIPYMLVRGLSNRITTWMARSTGTRNTPKEIGQ